MQLIEASTLPAVPWKNGGGTTQTVAISPESAGFDDFAWRVSIAEVRESGSFSSFPDVDRTIVLLDGAGMILQGSNGSAYALTTPFEPHSMRGEDAVDAHLVNGPAHDFNVMARRGRAQATVKVWDRPDSLAGWTGDAVFYCPRGDFEVSVGGEAAWLPASWACSFSGRDATVHVAPKAPNAVLIGALFELSEIESEEAWTKRDESPQ
jgi:uncharacterized protein